MEAQVRALLRLDLGAIDLHKGLMGLSAILAFAAFVAVFGDIGMVAGLATVFVILADTPGPPRGRAVGIFVMTIAGAAIALVGVWAGTSHLLVSVALTFGIVSLATLAAGIGPAFALRGMLLAIWAVIAISLAGEGERALELAIAFTGGGLIAAGVIYVRTRTLPQPSMEAEAKAVQRDLAGVIRSPLGWFAFLRAGAAALAMWLGATLFPEHVAWAGLTVVLVMKPKAGEAIAAGVLRSIGTVLGILAAEALIAVSDGETIIILGGFLVAAFAMAALQKVNYAVFVACLTALLVLVAELTTGTGESAAVDRLLATLLGAAIAFVGIAIGRVILGRPVIAVGSEPITEGEDQTPG